MNASQWLHAWRRGDPAVRSWYADDAFEWRSAVKRRDAAPSNPLSQDEVAEWQRWLAAGGADEDTQSQAALLTDPQTLCVVTGQQAGLGLGPLYTLWKAVSAIALAAAVGAETGRPCVPIFWIASDDHDLREISWLSWLDQEGRFHREEIPWAVERTGAPAHDVVPEQDAWEAACAALLSSVRESEFTAELREFLSTGGSYEDRFLRKMLMAFRGTPLVPVAPRLSFLRRRMLPLLRQELSRPMESARTLQAVNDRLREDHGVSGIHRSGTECNFFLEHGPVGNIVRGKLEWSSGLLVVRHPITGAELARHTAAEAMAMAEEAPERFSPNAALRPLAQDLALPTVTYVGGPSELIYHAQIGPLYRSFAVPRPAVFPRAEGAYLEPRIVRHLVSFGVDAASARAMSRDDLAAALAPQGDEAPSSPRESLLAALRAWRDGAPEDLKDNAVAASLEKLEGTVTHGAERLGQRVEESRARRSGTLESRRRQVLDALFPDGEPQERVLGPAAPMLNQLGLREWISAAPRLDFDDAARETQA